MTVEAATTIAQLNPAWPLFDDQIIEGDDHIRLLKIVLQADALSRSLGTPQIIVGPVSFNGLLTAKAGTRHESAAPFIDFRETDQALPLGLYRFALNGNIFGFQRNTAVAGDFATSTSIWSYTPADGYLNFPTAKFTGVPRVESIQPRLELRETDTTLPGGLFRSMASAGNFHIQANTAVAGDFATATDLLKYTGSTGRLNFGVPVDFTGGFSPGQSLELAGAAPTLLLTETDQTDPAGRFRIIADGNAVSFQKALTAAWATTTPIWSYSGATGQLTFSAPISSMLEIAGGTPMLRLNETDQTDPAGRFAIAGINDGVSMYRYATANWLGTTRIWNYTTSINEFTFDVNVGIGASSTTATVLELQGTGAANYIDSAAAIPLIFRTSPGNTINARIDVAGTAALTAQSIITREKGDLRYLSVAGGDVTGTLKVIGAAPQVSFDETDQAGAAGLWRLISNGDIFFLQKNTAAADDFSTSSSIWSSLPTGEFRTYPLTQLAQTHGMVEIGHTGSSILRFLRTGNINHIQVPAGASLRVTDHSSTSWAAISSTSGWAAGASDIRLKENVQPVPYGLDAIMALRPVAFDWIEEKRHDIGFIAQEVEEIIPEIVEIWEADPDVEGQIDTYAMRKDALTVILVRAVQELTARLEALEGTPA